MNVKWEELTVYKPLKKEELKAAYKQFSKIIAENMAHFGFKAKGRMLIKRSGELLHIIHLDTRGSWTGLSDSFKTEVAIVSVYDEGPFIFNYELNGTKKIREIVPNLRNYNRITQEYELLADFLTRKIIGFVLQYFEQYSNAIKILDDKANFSWKPAPGMALRNGDLILFCELHLHRDYQAAGILSELLALYQTMGVGSNNETVIKLKHLYGLLLNKNWEAIDEILAGNRDAVLKKLKL